MLTLKSTLKLSALADKMQLEIKNIKNATPEEIGADIIGQVIRKAHRATNEIVEFVAEYKKISKEEAENIDIMEVVEILKSEKGIVSFFK